VTDMSFLFQGMSQFNVDISQWEMSQVTTAAGMFEGAASFSQAINGWILTSGANTTGMFTGADTWLSRASRTDGSDTTGRAAECLVRIRPLLGKRARAVELVRCMRGLASTTARATTRRSVWTPSATDLGHVMH